MDPRLHNAAWVAKRLRVRASDNLTHRDLVALASCLESVTISRGGVLYKPGKPPRGVWIIRTGAVELAVGSGTSRCVVQILRNGDMVGDVYLLLGMTPPFTARAIEEAQCLFVPADAFEQLLERHSSLGVLWLANVSSRLVRSRGRILDVLAKRLPERVARVLIQESPDGSVRLSQRTLADMLGVQRSSINKVLKEFQQNGLVELGYARVYLKDREALELLASGVRRQAAFFSSSSSSESSCLDESHTDPAPSPEGSQEEQPAEERMG